MKKLKKLPVLLLCLCIMSVLMPATALAADGNTANVSTKEEFEAAANDSSVTVINVTTDIDLTFSDGYVLDVSGKTINLGGNTVSATNFTLIFEGSNFVIRGGTLDSKGGSYALFIGDEGTTDNVLVENVTTTGGINVYNSSNVTLRNVNVTGTAHYAVWCDENGKVTIESGSFQSNGVAVLGLTAAEKDSALDITGGDFAVSGQQPLVLPGNYGAPIITGGTYNTPPTSYVPGASASIGYTSGGSTVYAVGASISDVVKGAGEGDTITVLTGDVALQIRDKVVVKNEGGGAVSVNGQTVGQNETITSHVFGTEWKFDDKEHWHECTDCSLIADKAAHTFVWMTGKAATAAEKGSKHEQCSICGYRKAAVEIPAAGTTSTAGTDSSNVSIGSNVSVKTGDTSNTVLWGSILAASAAVMGALALTAKKRKHNL